MALILRVSLEQWLWLRVGHKLTLVCPTRRSLPAFVTPIQIGNFLSPPATNIRFPSCLVLSPSPPRVFTLLQQSLVAILQELIDFSIIPLFGELVPLHECLKLMILFFKILLFLAQDKA